MALNQGLEIVPVINKIDLPAADPDRVRHEIEEVLALPAPRPQADLRASDSADHGR